LKDLPPPGEQGFKYGIAAVDGFFHYQLLYNKVKLKTNWSGDTGKLMESNKREDVNSLTGHEWKFYSVIILLAHRNRTFRAAPTATASAT